MQSTPEIIQKSVNHGKIPIEIPQITLFWIMKKIQ